MNLPICAIILAKRVVEISILTCVTYVCVITLLKCDWILCDYPCMHE